MREALRNLLGAIIPDHAALAYERYAPVDEYGRIPDSRRRSWLEELERIPIPRGYPAAFEQWRGSLDDGHTRSSGVRLTGRLLIGHGNLSATEIGLTLHHTWGVPVVPGSALKGLTAHYVDAVYGPDSRGPHPFDPAVTGGAAERARFQGITWRDGRPEHGPGDVYRTIFGAPPAEDDLEFEGAGETQGSVIFHDAWYVPPEVTPGNAMPLLPLAQDVITVHQKTYYEAAGRGHSPNDYDDPVPISFLTVKPGTLFLLAVSGPPALTELALHLLHAALEEWGVGGKTSSGYGRLVQSSKLGSAGAGHEALRPTGPQRRAASRTASAGREPRYQRDARITVTRVEDPSGKGKSRFVADDGVLGHFVGAAPEVDIGAAIDVWIANVGGGTYTLTLQAPKAGPPKRRKR